MNMRERIRSRVFGIFSVFVVELLLLMGCSTTPAPKPQEAMIQPQQQTVVSKSVKPDSFFVRFEPGSTPRGKTSRPRSAQRYLFRF